MQLAAVLERWRETRDPKLGDLVVEMDRVAAPVALGLPKLLEALGSRDVQVASLIPAIDHVVRTARASWPVVELIAELPPDPRVGRLALSLLRDFTNLPHTSAKLWRRLLDTVERHGDPSCIAPLQAVQPRDALPATRSRIANLAKRLAQARRLTKEELAELDGEVVAATDGPDLLAAVYADPASDPARAIYADYLLGLGDPRGEFIQLQLQRAAGRGTEAGEKRELALVKKHARAWAGPIAALVSSGISERGPGELEAPGLRGLTFARGFIVRTPPLNVPAHRESVLDDPIWSTVEHVFWVPRLTPAMHSVRSVSVAWLALLDEPRTFDQLTFQAPELRRARPEVFQACRVKRLVLELGSSSERTLELLAMATRDNPTLVEIALSGGSQQDLMWGWRDLAMPHVKTLSVGFREGQLEVRRKDDHLEITSLVDDPAYWRALLGPLRERPFASARITGEAVATVARELAIARVILA